MKRIAALIATCLIFGSACNLVGYGPITMYGINWFRYKAKSDGELAFTDPVGACLAEVRNGKWLCQGASYPTFYGVWIQTARIDSVTGCLKNWDNGSVLTCPGWINPPYPQRIWDRNGPAGYGNGQRGPL